MLIMQHEYLIVNKGQRVSDSHILVCFQFRRDILYQISCMLPSVIWQLLFQV